MAEVASAFVSLLPSAKGFGKSTERQIGPQMNSVAKRTGSRFGKVFATATVSPLRAIGAAAIGLFAVKKIKDFFGSAISEARESQKVSAITAQVIKTTGGAAGIAASAVGRLAGQISNMTGIDDEAIQAGANLLLTFKNIRNEAGAGNDIFNQTTQIMTDMATAMGKEPKSAAIQLGKALNDPIKGISALSRVGVTFSDQQKKVIESLVASGDVMGAQKIILRELKSEFGGTAAAAATAGEKFKTTFANFQESIGTALLPYLDRAQLAGIKLILLLQNDVPRAFKAFKDAVAPAIEAVRSFVEDHLVPFKLALSALAGSALTSVITLIGGSLVSALAVLVGALASPIALIGAAAGAAIYAYVHFEGFRNQVNSLALAAREKLIPALTAFVAFVREQAIPALIQAGAYINTNVIPALQRFGQVLVSDVLPIVRGFVTFVLTEFYPTMIKAWAVVAQKLAPVFVALGQAYQTKVLPIQRQVLAQLREYGPVIGPVVANITRMIAALAVLGATISGKTLPPAIRLATALTGPVFSGLVKVMEASNRTEAAIGQFARSVVQGVAKVVGSFQSLPGKVSAALSGLYDIGKHAAEQLVAGLVNTIKSKVADVANAASGIAGAIKDKFPGSPVKNGPLTVWNDGSPGKILMGFLAKGITDGGTEVDGAANKVAENIRSRFEHLRDALKSTLDGLKSDFGSLRDSISGAFGGDLFSATSASDFLSGGFKQSNLLDKLSAAFKKLRKWGIDSQFIGQLFASGNAPLILDLAGGGRGQAVQAAGVFDLTQSQSKFLGSSVASTQFGSDIKGVRQELREVNKKLASLPKHIGKEINHAATSGHKGRAA